MIKGRSSGHQAMLQVFEIILKKEEVKLFDKAIYNKRVLEKLCLLYVYIRWRTRVDELLQQPQPLLSMDFYSYDENLVVFK